MNATATVETGTVKVGRWTYPATRVGSAVSRNTKRDGTGESVEVKDAKTVETFEATASSVVETAPVAPAPADAVETDEVVEATDKLTPVQRQVFAMIGRRGRPGFDFFDDGVVEGSGIWFTHMSEQTPNPAQTRREITKLVGTLVELGAPDDVAHGRDRWMSLTALGARVAVALAGVTYDADAWKPVSTSGHGSRPGAQTKKPGRSTWKVGDPCPQGTHILTEELIYAMPSGRTQCRGCRQGYPSNN